MADGVELFIVYLIHDKRHLSKPCIVCYNQTNLTGGANMFDWILYYLGLIPDVNGNYWAG